MSAQISSSPGTDASITEANQLRVLRSVVAITWEEHRRTRSICSFFDLELHVLETRVRGLRRYTMLAWRTTALLFRRRPRAVLIQSPSIVLALLTVLLRPLFKFKLIMDAHNEAVDPFINPSMPIRILTHWLLRKADATIVTNKYLANTVTSHGGTALVLPDKIPTAPVIRPASRVTHDRFAIVVIATFASDEPMGEIFKAAAAVQDECQFFVTGNPAKLAFSLRAEMPANVTLTGFLPDQDYWTLLSRSDLVLDLTLIDNCLVCGAYEALAVGTPMLLSNNAATADLFVPAAVCTQNDHVAIVTAIHDAKARIHILRDNVTRTRDRLEREWLDHARTLTAKLANFASTP